MKCVWEECWPEEGDSKKNSPTKGIAALWHQHNVWEEMTHGGRSRTGTRAPEPCHARSLTVGHLLSSGMASLQLTALPAVCIICDLGQGNDAFPGLDLCEPQCPERCLGAVIKCHNRNKKKGRQERLQILKCPYLSCGVSA